MARSIAAGPELAPAARAQGPRPAGQAVLTPGFRLPARHVIHAVGPVWVDGQRDEDERLASCYVRSLELAGNAGLGSIAFPCISTGAYGFPRERAARIALGTVIGVVRWIVLTSLVRVCPHTSLARWLI